MILYMKFLVDCTLGKLVLWLRVLGYDTIYCETTINNGSILKRGIEEKRIIITRCRDSMQRNYTGSMIVISADKVWDQLEEMKREINFVPDPGKLFSRCVNCNSELRRIDRMDVKGLVPTYVYETHTQFKSCCKCGRIFWPGTHRERMLTALAEHNLIHHL